MQIRRVLKTKDKPDALQELPGPLFFLPGPIPTITKTATSTATTLTVELRPNVTAGREDQRHLGRRVVLRGLSGPRELQKSLEKKIKVRGRGVYTSTRSIHVAHTEYNARLFTSFVNFRCLLQVVNPARVSTLLTHITVNSAPPPPHPVPCPPLFTTRVSLHPCTTIPRHIGIRRQV